MRNISLATYAIEVRKRHSRKLECLSNFDGADLQKLLNDFLTGRRSAIDDPTQKILLKVRTHESSLRHFFGTVEIGDYGYTSDIVDVASNKVSYSRKKGEAALSPFFFHLFVPEGETQGILALQRVGNVGIREIFAENFRKFFMERHAGYSVNFNPVVHPEQLKKYTSSGDIKKLTFRQTKLPKDICDQYSDVFDEKDAYVEYTIVAKRNGNLSGIRRKLAQLTGGQNNRQQVLQDPPGITADKVTVEISAGGRSRTLDVSDLTKIRSYYNLDGEVVVGLDGHPNFADMKAVSIDVVNEIWQSIKGVSDAK